MKKLICTLMILMLFFSSFSYALTILYKDETETKISSGVNLNKQTILTDVGWLNIQMLKIDLEDKYTELGVLTSEKGAGKLDTVLNMATNASAIAAVNGDFFAGSKGQGHSVGLTYNNSNIISSAAIDNLSKNTFASFVLNEDNDIFLDYFSNKITLTSKKTKESIDILTINKFADDYSKPVLYTKEWGEYSLGSSEGLILTEMVVKNNKVIDILYNSPAIEIPENGFVISTLGTGADFINDNFKKGTKINLDISFLPSLEDISLAISGGAKLLDDGEIPETFSHNASGRNPRTALGIDKDEETLYLITLDGRKETSIGMTQTELAEFMKSENIYNAINLDGGGSTTMVAQELGHSSLSVINNPSSSSLRSVINAIGVFSKAPKSSKLYGLNVEIEDRNIFKGEEREFKITGYNKYYNPVEIDFDDIEFDFDGVDLIIEDGKISGNTVGTCILTASIGKVKTDIEINILSDANELFIYPKETYISPNKKVNYTIEAKNKNGYYAKTNMDTISAKILEYYKDGEKQNEIPTDAKFENFSFIAQTPGEYLLEFSKGNIFSYAIVSVSSTRAVILDDFETKSFKFDEYPDEVRGDAKLSNEQVYSGKTSVKLEYDFNQDIQIRGAYIELNAPLTIPKDAISLSFWVYNDNYKDEQLKIKLKDANGATKLLVLENNISHEGWKEINYNLSNIALPATISDIYLAQDDLSIKNSGHIYVDKLAYYTNSIPSKNKIRIPEDIKLEDSNNSNLENKETYNIALLDNLETPTLMIDQLKNITLINSINKNCDLTIFTNHSNEDNIKNIQTEKILHNGYDLIEKENMTFICLDVSNNSLRTSDATQWNNFIYDIKDSENKNIFIVLNASLDSFTDVKERKAIIDTLCELKRETKRNITVLHSGYFTGYTMERGIKFLGINTQNISSKDIAKKYSYILISITEDSISYKEEKIF